MGKATLKIGPTSEQKDYIDRINNPRTGQDLVLALSNPSTPAYKEMMNMLIAEIDIQVLIHRLTERYIHNEIILYDKEREAVYHHYLESVIAFEKAMHQQVPHIARTFERSSLDKWDANTLKVEWVKCAEAGEKLKQKSDELHLKIAEINQRKDKNTAAWNKNIEKNVQDSLTALEKSGEKTYVWDAKKGSIVALDLKETKVLLEETASPPPADLINILYKSYFLQPDAEASTPVIPLAPLPPPLPDKRDLTADFMVKKGHAIQELKRSAKNLPDAPYGYKIMLDVINKNKKASQQLAGVFFKNIEHETHLMQDGINNFQEEWVTKWASQQADDKLAQNVKLLKKIERRYEDLTGKPVKRNVHFSSETHSKPQKQK